MPRLTVHETWDRSNVIHQILFGTMLPLGDKGIVKGFEEAILVAGKLALWFRFRKLFPGHFTRPAHARYKYATRKRWYIFQKLRKYPESRGLDMVYSGDWMRATLMAPRSRPTGRKKLNGFLFKMALVQKDYVWKNKYIDMHGEATSWDAVDYDMVRQALIGICRVALGFSSVEEFSKG